jgi:hypothetical protein
VPVLEVGEGVHVLPVNDLVEHELSEDCVCGPWVELLSEEDLPLVVHHALDGRE